MRIGYSQLDSDREFDDRHDKPDLKIREIKSTAYPIGKVWDCPIFCLLDSRIFDGDFALRHCWFILVSHDVFLHPL